MPQPTHYHKKTGTYLAVKQLREKFSTFFVVDKEGNLQYMSGSLKRFHKLCITSNDNVVPIRTKTQLTMEIV